jgi:hypothetical protein
MGENTHFRPPDPIRGQIRDLLPIPRYCTGVQQWVRDMGCMILGYVTSDEHCDIGKMIWYGT